MIAVTLRGLLTRKLRTLLTMIAILLGVSMVSGTYVFTDTINSAFSSIFDRADKNIDVVVIAKSPIGGSSFSNFQPPSFPSTLLSVVRTTPGVAAAEGAIADQAQIFDLKGKSIGAIGGAPTLLFSEAGPRFRQSTLVRGHWPTGNQVVVDEDTFSRHHLRLGERILVTGSSGKARRMQVVGSTRLGSANNFGGASTVEMDLLRAQQITGKLGEYDDIAVGAAVGTTRDQLVQTIRSRIPAGLRQRVKVETGSQLASDSTKAIGDALSFLTIGLLVFGGVAIFVGAFIIFNTFSITVAQRLREFGLLRTLGASRRQILESVLLEALAVGVLSSVIGLLAGLLIAKGLNAAFQVLGAALPTTGLILQTRTIVIGLLVGTVVTAVAAFWPAVRATQIPPVAALREGARLPRGRFARFTPYAALLVGILGLGVLLFGVFGSVQATGQRLSLIGAGAVLLFLGVAMITPKLVQPLAGIIGWPMEWLTRITGRLARENAVRNPGRTAVTAAALMIGLALVGFVTIFAAELTKTADDAVTREIAGVYSIYSDAQGFVPAGAQQAIVRVPGVATVSAINSDQAKIRDAGTLTINGVQPASILSVYKFQWKQGSDSVVTHLSPRQALIADTFAAEHNLHVGSTIQVTTSLGTTSRFKVVGVFKASQFLGNLVLAHDTITTLWHQSQDEVLSLSALPGTNLRVLGHRLDRLLKAQYPQVTSHSQEQIRKNAQASVNQLVTLIYLLLALSVLVSLFGIINTLVLSVYERTREIGMLRAIGMTRTQVRWLIRWESVITAVIGAVLGLLLGILLAVVVTQGLSSQGIEFAFPIGQLLIWVLFAIVFGIVAAAFPARRAARLDVLQAIAYE